MRHLRPSAFALALAASASCLLMIGGCGGDGEKSEPDAGPGAEAGPDAMLGGLCEAPSVPDPCTGDGSRFVVLARIATPDVTDDRRVDGFDLDCRSDEGCRCGRTPLADGGSESKCEDFTSPGGASGIDNQFSQLEPPLTDALDFDFDGQLAGLIADGDLLLLLALENLDTEAITDGTDDECVTGSVALGFVPGGGAPEFEEGALKAGLTFNLDRRSLDDSDEPTTKFTGRIVDGRLDAGPVDIPLSLPVGAVSVDVTVEDARLTGSLTGEGIDGGLIGGVLDVEGLLGAIQSAATGFGDLDAILRPVLNGFADMNPGTDGDCTAVSAALEFQAVPAVKGEPGTP